MGCAHDTPGCGRLLLSVPPAFVVIRDCRDNGTRHRLRLVLEGTLRELLPVDVAERCSGQIHVAVTRLTPGLQPTLVSHFRDREDLIQALLTSCHIPWYFDGSLIRSFRGTPCFDGGGCICVVFECAHACNHCPYDSCP